MDEQISDGRQRQMTDWASVRYAVADVEGNGQQPPDLVELAVVPIINGIIAEPTSWLVKPPRPIAYMATRIHGLKDQDVAAAQAFADIEGEVRRALNADVLVAHNAHVDVGVLRRHLDEWECPEVFDTLRLARRLLPGQASYKLGALVSAFSLADGLSASLVPHRATYDVLVTARLFVRLATHADTSRLSLDELRGQEPGGDSDAPSLF
jgi:exodeoxyribonuclease X